jgi:hypothetical protein
MQSPRAPLYVFFAAFLTFLIAFATLLTVLKPELDKRRQSGEQAASSSGAAPDAKPAADPKLEPKNDAKTDPKPDPKDPKTPKPALAGMAQPATSPAPKEAGRDGTPKEKRSEPKAGSVTIEIKGRVVDPRGSAVADAQVHVLVSAKGKGESSAWPLITKPVGGDGSFDFHAAVPAGGAFLLATAPGFVRSDTKALPSSGPFDAGSLALKNGGALRVRVSGDEAGKLANAEVSLVDHGNGPADLAPSDVTAKTGDDGVALLRGIDRGAFKLRVRANGHADSESDWRYDGTGRNGTEEVAVVLLPLVAFVSGTVGDLDRLPVTQGEVAVHLAQGDPPAPQEWRGPIDSHGQFRIGPVPKGQYAVNVVAPGMVQKTEVFADADGDSVELTVEHGGTIVGRLKANEGAIPPSVHITVWKVDSNGRTQPVDGAYRAEVNKNTSKFRVDGIAPGRYYVRAAAEGFASGRSAPFSLAAGETSNEVAIALGSGGSLQGVVVDSRGAPVKDARVTLYEGTSPPPTALIDLFPANARSSMPSREDGRFEFTGFSPGAAVLVIEASGQPARTIGPLLLSENDAVLLGSVSLGGGTILSATVLGARGKPMPFGCGLLLANDGKVRAPFVADEEGNFCLRGVAQGDYVLSGLDGSVGRTEVTLRADETRRVQLAVERR